MATCKDCIHYEACNEVLDVAGFFSDDIEEILNWIKCPNFADRSRFVELPCKIGQKLYDISEFIDDTPHPQMYELKADYITFYNKFPDRTGIGMTIDDWEYNLSDFGKIVFRTKEEAEAAIAERTGEK